MMHHHHHHVVLRPAPPSGEIDGARAMVFLYDYTVMAGTQGMINHHKKDRLFAIAEQLRTPVVFFTEVPIDPIRRFIRSVVVFLHRGVWRVPCPRYTARFFVLQDEPLNRPRFEHAAPLSPPLWRPLLRATVQIQWRCDSFVRPT
jgi:hypothetical protein